MRERDALHIIKKYPNRRLYDTQTSTYITLVDVKRMVLEKDEFEVRDAKTNEDLTRSIMLQIILDEESGGVPLFSSELLAQIIRSYGHVMQGMLGSYLEKNMQAFADIQSDLAGGAQTDAQQKIDNEVWQQLLAMQAPMMQDMMSNYIEQSRKMFLQMREIMASQTAVLFQSLGDGTLKPDLLKSDLLKPKKSSKGQPSEGQS